MTTRSPLQDYGSSKTPGQRLENHQTRWASKEFAKLQGTPDMGDQRGAV